LLEHDVMDAFNDGHVNGQNRFASRNSRSNHMSLEALTALILTFLLIGEARHEFV
jgi:hypothetical protein